MKKVNLDKINEFRKLTGAGIMNCKKALEESDGDVGRAKEWLLEKGDQIARKKVGRETKRGVVSAYIHTDGRVGAIVKLGCETDFVAQTEKFKKLAFELAMQVVAMRPKTVKELLGQEYIRNQLIKVADLIKEEVVRVKENIKVESFYRLEI